MWPSILNTFSIDSGSMSLELSRLSTISTTPSLNLMPTVVVPRLTASRAYSTWKSRPSGEKTVMARSYAMWPACIEIVASPPLER